MTNRISSLVPSTRLSSQHALNRLDRVNDSVRTSLQSDPRTFDAARMQNYDYFNRTPKPYGASRSQPTTQSKPSQSSNKKYSGVSSIDKGNISYYCGEITNNVFNPMTHRPGMTLQSVYVDPNGIAKPTFDIDPRRLTRQSMDQKHESRLSFINDTALHREDIMANNLRIYNRQRYDTSFCR